MAGFPTIPSRDAFGPTRVDDGIPPDDERYVGARHFNLAFWQLAGLGIVSARAYARCTFSSGALTIAEHGEAWAPNGGGAAPAPTKNATGSWSIAYAAAYLDADGGSVDTELRFVGRIRNSDDVDQLVEVYLNTDKRTIELRVFNRGSGAAADPPDDDEIILFAY